MPEGLRRKLEGAARSRFSFSSIGNQIVMPDLTERLRRKLKKTCQLDEPPRQPEPFSPEGLPILPAGRQLLLTPSPSRENLVSVSTTGSPFFKRLPWELRNQIYLAAFGNQTVHMDLQCNYNELPLSPNSRIHAGSKTRLECNDHPGWYWWSSVCRRNPQAEYFYNNCRCGGDPTRCNLFPGKMPGNCFLGVMGWLLSCRRA